MRRLIAISVLLLCSCVGRDNTGIPCEDYNDLQCPTGYWCKSALLVNTQWECAPLDEDPPPELVFVGVAVRGQDDLSDMPDSAFGDVVTLVNEKNDVVVRVRNIGGQARLAPALDIMASDCCMGADTFFRTGALARVEPGDDYNFIVAVDRPGRDCPSDQTLTISVPESEGGVTLSETFDVTLMPPEERTVSPTSCMGQPEN